jgi:hypothetical protein
MKKFSALSAASEEFMAPMPPHGGPMGEIREGREKQTTRPPAINAKPIGWFQTRRSRH